MPSLAAVLETHDTTRDAFNAWLRIGALSTDFSTRKGARRDLTLENVIEVGFFAALTRADVDLSFRGGLARLWLEGFKGGTLPAVAALDRSRLERPTYAQPGETVDGLLFRLGRFRSGWVGDEDNPHGHKPAVPTEVRLIHLAEIVRRSEKMFAEDPEDVKHSSSIA